MQKNEIHRPYCLSIAGFDPSGGAGLVADAKTMEQIGVYGLTVCTAVTVQHESAFEQVEWMNLELIKQQIILLIHKYSVNCCKIGLVENWQVLTSIIDLLLEEEPSMKIVLDPIFRATAGFDFHNKVGLSHLESFLPKIYLLTPNAQELKRIGKEGQDLMEVAKSLANYCAILYKGGHNEAEKGTDYLLSQGEVLKLLPKEKVFYEKHGSGCVLSAAIVACLALGFSLEESCEQAKRYISAFLNSNATLLGYHV